VPACRAGLPGQAVALAGLLCLVLAGLGEVFVEGHGLLLDGGCDWWLAAVSLRPG
jgi:hypothetical protein